MDMQILLAGFGGGIIRGLVGYIKYQTSYKNVPFKLWYFLSLVIASGIIGLAAGWLVKGVVEMDGTLEITNFYAFIAGYAGGDFIENIYKIIAKKQSLYSISKN
jgi:hypothetical protein